MLYIGDNNIKIFRFSKDKEYYRIMLDSFGFIIQAHQGLHEADFLEAANIMRKSDADLFKKLTESLHPFDPLYKELKKGN